MANCPSCGAPITHTHTADGEHVPVENYEDTTGDKRYRIVKVGPPHIVEAVAEGSPTPAFPDHRKECPAHANGLSR